MGERLCLDFANTIEDPKSAAPEDFLRSYADLVHWGRHVGLLSEGQGETLLAEAKHRPDEAAATFSAGLALRAVIQDVFLAVAREDSPAERNLETLQTFYGASLAHAKLTPEEHGFDWVWRDERDLGRVLWPVARSAVDVLLEGDPARIKECEGADGCGWLFYDTSKNVSRRWCSMEGCGTRSKMRRYYARRRAAQN